MALTKKRILKQTLDNQSHEKLYASFYPNNVKEKTYYGNYSEIFYYWTNKTIHFFIPYKFRIIKFRTGGYLRNHPANFFIFTNKKLRHKFYLRSQHSLLP